MRQLHYLSWAGYALIAFLVIPVIRAQSEVIEKLAVAKVYVDMSMFQLSGQDI